MVGLAQLDPDDGPKRNLFLLQAGSGGTSRISWFCFQQMQAALRLRRLLERVHKQQKGVYRSESAEACREDGPAVFDRSRRPRKGRSQGGVQPPSLFGPLKENKSFLLSIRRKTNLPRAPRCMAASPRGRTSRCSRLPP